MTRTVEWGMALAALALTAAFAAGVSGYGPAAFRGNAPAAAADGYYHAGKIPVTDFGSDGCRAPGCHPAVPHAKIRAQAAFRNMHLRFVDCLACHGKDARESWVAGARPDPMTAGGDGRLRTAVRLAVRTAPVTPDKMHGLIGPALPCRACHSDEGLREMAAKGIRDLPSGFANPVPLRMIEEGAKQWIPDSMR